MLYFVAQSSLILFKSKDLNSIIKVFKWYFGIIEKKINIINGEFIPNETNFREVLQIPGNKISYDGDNIF